MQVCLHFAIFSILELCVEDCSWQLLGDMDAVARTLSPESMGKSFSAEV